MSQENVSTDVQSQNLTIDDFKNQILEDYKLVNISRQASLLGRKEVLTGKAKFGIFGDGKELAQVAMAKSFKNGDFRSGYYRDQTFMMAIGQLTVRQFFAQLYADTTPGNEPASSGRMMNGHFGTYSLDENGNWLNLLEQKNSSSDVSPTASQMLRLLGLAYASKLYRNNPDLHFDNNFSNKGNEVAFGTIGNASSAEGLFWETINAGGVLMVPMAVSLWDDGYGISVPGKYQITKDNLSEVLSGFHYSEENNQGYSIYVCNGWDYPGLVRMYSDGIDKVRAEHIPAIFHIKEMTQPQGHSTSGSHERYKSKERIQWEEDFDCIKKFKEWILSNGILTLEELSVVEEDAKSYVKKEQKAAWDDYLNPINQDKSILNQLLLKLAEESQNKSEILAISQDLMSSLDLERRTQYKAWWRSMRASKDENLPTHQDLKQWKTASDASNYNRYNANLYSGTALKVTEVLPTYDESAPLVDGREVLMNFFETAFKNDPRIFAFGEDVGKIGDVNQGMAGMQEKFGELRVTDTGIREASILGQGIGAAMRGLRPIAEIQYLDYLAYALQIMSDDLSTLYYRTNGRQKAPLIVRTRGHRLEGIWHSGSPMGFIINAVRGMYVCVPRNMTQAARFYNTLLKADEPGLIIERLNGYRQKEKLPTNLADMTLPLGQVETIRNGQDITLVTYGACVEIAEVAAKQLSDLGVEITIIDCQTLLPFDLNHNIVKSLQETNRLVVLDEDVPGGASAFILKNILEDQKGYQYLDSAPLTITSKEHRPAFGSDGDYFSKPSAEDITAQVYALMHEVDPNRYPMFW